ncbi:MAG: aldolase [Clostridiales bacterium]|nr:aldolase [Clostridiales bacterium]
MSNIKMRPSKVLQKLRSGEVAICTKLNLNDSRVVEIAAMAGFDCIWTDMEHVPNDWSAIEKQVLASKVYDTDILVRVTRGSYSDHIKPFEMDATGIMVPHVMNYEDAKNVAWMTKFHPIGRRPIDGGNADGAYCNIDMLDYMEQANKERYVMIQIEDPEPLEDLEKIAQIEGIDIIFFGPGDFSQGIGAPAQWEHPLMLETQKRVAEIAIKNGKFAGTVAIPEDISQLVDMGYRFISMGSDVMGLNGYFNDVALELNKKIFAR